MFTQNKHTTNKNLYQKTDHFSDVTYLQIRMTDDGFGRRMTDSDVKSDRHIRLFNQEEFVNLCATNNTQRMEYFEPCNLFGIFV